MHWGSETVYVSSLAKLHNIFEIQHMSWFPPPLAKRRSRDLEYSICICLNRFAGDTYCLRQLHLQSFKISAGVVFHLKDFTIWKG